MIIVGIEPSGNHKEDFIRFQCYARRFPNCLFLFDNLDEPSLARCLPSRSAPVDILVTTRRFQQSSDSVQVLNLQLPTKSNAVQILCKGAPFLLISSDDPVDLKGKDLEYAEKIVGPDGVDRLPLALHHIRAFTREDANHITMEELWEDIGKNRCSISLDPRSLEEWLQHYHLKSLIPDQVGRLEVSSLDDLRSLSDGEIMESSLSNANKVLLVKAKQDLVQRPSVGPWRLDIERVCSKSRVCLDILSVAALLPSQRILVNLLQDCIKNLSTSNFSTIRFNRDLRQIENFSLMTSLRDAADSQERIMHPFIQDTIKQCIVPAGELKRYLSSLCEVLLQLLPSLEDVRLQRGLNSPSVARHSSDLYHVAGIVADGADEQETWREVLALGCMLAIHLHHSAVAKSLCQKMLIVERQLKSHLLPSGVVCLPNFLYVLVTVCLFAVLAVTAVAYSMDRDESSECYGLLNEALEFLKNDPPIGNKEVAKLWALGMHVSNGVRKLGL